MYSFTLSLTSALDEVGGQPHGPAALPSGERPGTHCIGSWVRPRASLDGFGKFAATGIRSPDRPARSKLLYRLSHPGAGRKNYIRKYWRRERNQRNKERKILKIALFWHLAAYIAF